MQRLVARDTVEEKILLLQNRKQEMADAALGSGTGAPPITREDILELLTGTS